MKPSTWVFPAPDDSTTVLLINRWEKEENLETHHHSPMMEVIARLREKTDLHMRVERDVTNTLCDSTADAAFVRE